MSKSSGLGQAFYLAGYDITGDVGSIESAKGMQTLLDLTGIDKSAPERVGGERSGELNWTSYWNTTASVGAQAILKALPTADVDAMWLLETAAIGSQAACLRGKQVNYDPTLGKDGSLVAKTQVVTNGYPLHYCDMLTAGKRTDTGATNGTSLDFGAVSTLFGMSAYLQVFSVTGTSVTVKIQDSADNVTFADITGLTFTAATPAGSPQTQFLQTATGATIRRYVRVATTGTFNPATFAVAAIRHLTSTI